MEAVLRENRRPTRVSSKAITQGRRQGWGPGGPDPPPQSREKGGGVWGPVQRQEEGGAKSVQEGPKLQIFLALRANNTSEITTILHFAGNGAIFQ